MATFQVSVLTEKYDTEKFLMQLALSIIPLIACMFYGLYFPETESIQLSATADQKASLLEFFFTGYFRNSGHVSHKLISLADMSCDFLSKFSGGHLISHRGLKLNSKISAGEYKKNKIHRGQLIFYRGAKQKLCLKYAEIP